MPNNEIKSFSDFNILPDFPLTGVKVSIMTLIDQPIILLDFKIKKTKDVETGIYQEALQLQFYKECDPTVTWITFTRSKIIKKQLQQFNESNLPCKIVVKQDKKSMYLA